MLEDMFPSKGNENSAGNTMEQADITKRESSRARDIYKEVDLELIMDEIEEEEIIKKVEDAGYT